MTLGDLALLGGTPVRSKPIPSYNTIGPEEKRAVMEVLDSGELSGFVASPDKYFWGGERVQALERAFREHFGSRHAIAVNSATSGLHTALMALDLSPNDEVLVPPYTMSATATTVLMCGAVPVFVDVDPNTFCMDPAAAAAAITDRTRGIVAVNLFGHPADLDALRQLADAKGIFLLEDNAQAPDADYCGRKTGMIGHAGVFSFNRHKTMQCGEGGMIVTNDDRIALKAALFRNHGEAVVDAMGVTDLVNAIGVNYRMGEMEAAVAIEQFRKLPTLNAARIALATRLADCLKKIPGISAPTVAQNCSHVYYFFVMKIDSDAIGIPRDVFVRAVNAEGFPLRAGYLRPLYLEPVYQRRVALGRNGFPFSSHSRTVSYSPGICPTVERLQDREVMLTNAIYPPLTLDDMDAFGEAFAKVVANRDALLAYARREAA
jgi:perosamine synthetase